ncbi:CinA family protein [Sphingobacterium deserti]|nr:CinA family protein [Sphingobacterium deserti]
MDNRQMNIYYKSAVAQCSSLLAEHHLSIAFAESATAGRLAYEFSLTPQSGDILKGGIVCYNACVKEDMLGVPKATIDTYTPESAEVTTSMCWSLKRKMSAEICVAITGLTTPGGSESPGKPVGTMFFSIVHNASLHEHRVVHQGSPEEIIEKTIVDICQTIIDILRVSR